MKRFCKSLYLLAALLMFGCSPSYFCRDNFNSEEFVRDSYKIKEGKFSILELTGQKIDPPGVVETNLLAEYKDTIHEGDVLQIILFHPKREDLVKAIQLVSQTIGFKVVNGKITLPGFNSITVTNLTLEEAKSAIEKEYLSQISNVEIFLEYKERMERKIELAGLVNIPSIPVDGKIRLFEVLSKAKIPPDANLFKSYVVRNGDILPVDLFKLLKEGDMSQNIVMRGGDKVYIAEPSAATLMVMGEVGTEKLVNLPKGMLSLREALAEAHGITFAGDKRCIQVIRGNLLHPKIYTLSWDHVINLPNDSLLLMPGDIVYVATKPISEWNRFISQILPTFVGVEAAQKGIKSIGVVLP